MIDDAHVISPSKCCTKCGTEKPLDAFSRSRKSRDGRKWMCKACAKEAHQAWCASHPEYYREYGRLYTEEHRESVATKRRAYKEANREKVNASARKWAENNREHVRQKCRESAARNKERNRSYLRRYYRENAEQIKANVEMRRKADPERRRLYSRQSSARRRAMMRKAGIGKVNYAAIIERDGMVCHICRKPVARKDLSFDHLIPISLGGPHTMDNIAVSHLSCNCSRGAGRIPAQLRIPTGEGQSRVVPRC